MSDARIFGSGREFVPQARREGSVRVTEEDREVLRRLAARKAETGGLAIQGTRRDLWTRMNRLERVKPLVWINEIPWHEMDVNDELTLRTTDPFLQGIEAGLRRELYQWEHMQGDMIVEPVVYSPLAINDTGFGIQEDVEIVRTDPRSGVVSRHFHIQIKDEDDAGKIKMPVVTHDRQLSDERFHALSHIFDGVIPVEKRGVAGRWFAPWDELIRLTGVQEAMTDLALRPGYIHTVMERLIAAYLCRLDQFEEQRLLSLNNSNVRVGSGGYGCSDEMPGPDFDPEHVRPRDMWGCGTAQIFSDVSPDMHWEFALQYELRSMERFALSYYGCCEPLHTKLGILKRVQNLRKISMSPWADIDKARANGAEDYVFSIKPNPAILAEDDWHPERAEAELRAQIEKARGCAVEVILKDISTVRYQPKRLWEWARMAAEVTERYG
ncbi:hypothetical protein ACFLSJ_06575 [Verrucomicrobiota bacterium]